MKYFLTTMAALVLVMTSFAQPQMPPQGQGRPDRMPPMIDQFEQKDPALMAQEETDRLDRLVGLSERQYKKIYKFNKRQYKALQRDMENARPQGFPEGMGPGGPGFGGGRPEGMGPGGPGGPRGGQRPEMGQGRPPMMGGSPELMQEFRVKQEKKYRQVLTPEQFQKWESFQAEREFRRMVERP